MRVPIAFPALTSLTALGGAFLGIIAITSRSWLKYGGMLNGIASRLGIFSFCNNNFCTKYPFNSMSCAQFQFFPDGPFVSILDRNQICQVIKPNQVLLIITIVMAAILGMLALVSIKRASYALAGIVGFLLTVMAVLQTVAVARMFGLRSNRYLITSAARKGSFGIVRAGWPLILSTVSAVFYYISAIVAFASIAFISKDSKDSKDSKGKKEHHHHHHHHRHHEQPKPRQSSMSPPPRPRETEQVANA